MNLSTKSPISLLSGAFDEYISGFIKKLSNSFDLNEDDVVKCYENYKNGVTIKKAPNKIVAKISKSSDSSEDEQTCERMMRFRNGKTRVCGKKPANNKLDGSYYCGTAEEGCYHIVLSKKAKKSEDKKDVLDDKKIIQKKDDDKLSTKKPTKVLEQLVNEVSSKLEDVTTTFRLTETKIKGVVYRLHPETNILFDKNNKPVGNLNTSGKIENLSKEQIKYLEKSNVQLLSDDDVSSSIGDDA